MSLFDMDPSFLAVCCCLSIAYGYDKKMALENSKNMVMGYFTKLSSEENILSSEELKTKIKSKADAIEKNNIYSKSKVNGLIDHEYHMPSDKEDYFQNEFTIIIPNTYDLKKYAHVIDYVNKYKTEKNMPLFSNTLGQLSLTKGKKTPFETFSEEINPISNVFKSYSGSYENVNAEISPFDIITLLGKKNGYKHSLKKVTGAFEDNSNVMRSDALRENGKIPNYIDSLLYREFDEAGKTTYAKWIHNLYDIAVLLRDKFSVDMDIKDKPKQSKRK